MNFHFLIPPREEFGPVEPGAAVYEEFWFDFPALKLYDRKQTHCKSNESVNEKLVRSGLAFLLY